MTLNFFDLLEENPIIASVKDEAMLDDAIQSPCMIIFLLGGNINNLSSMVNKVQKADKLVLLHFDLMNGLGRDVSALEYIAHIIKPNGIITTRSNIIAEAKKLKLFAIQRTLLLDSLAFENNMKSIRSSRPNAIEVIPGIIPKIITQINETVKVPLIAGGLILDKEDVFQALNAGALGISTSNQTIWYM